MICYACLTCSSVMDMNTRCRVNPGYCRPGPAAYVSDRCVTATYRITCVLHRHRLVAALYRRNMDWSSWLEPFGPIHRGGQKWHLVFMSMWWCWACEQSVSNPCLVSVCIRRRWVAGEVCAGLAVKVVPCWCWCCSWCSCCCSAECRSLAESPALLQISPLVTVTVATHSVKTGTHTWPCCVFSPLPSSVPLPSF